MWICQACNDVGSATIVPNPVKDSRLGEMSEEAIVGELPGCPSFEEGFG